MILLGSTARSYEKLTVVLGALFFLPALAAAQNRFAVIQINNDTKDVALEYQVRWGLDSEWQEEIKLEPGYGQWHWYTYERVNQEIVPQPQIRFKTGIGRPRTSKSYNLDAYPSANKMENGKRYTFQKRTDKSGEDYIDVFKVTGDERVAQLTDRDLRKVAGEICQEGQKNLAEKKYDEAIALLTKALEKAPTLALAYFHRARAYRAKHLYDKAIEDCTAALRIDRQHALAYNLRGLLHEDKADRNEAHADYTRAIEAQPNFAQAYINRGNLLFKRGQGDRGLEDFTKALSLKSSSTATWAALNGRGAVYYKRGDYNLAILECSSAIQFDPKKADAYRWRAQAHSKLGETELAKSDYAKAVELSPAQKILFETTSFLVDRREALRALESFQLGSTLSPERLKRLNDLPPGALPDKLESEISPATRQMLASERERFAALEFEMVAAADRLLQAARLSPAQREAQGMKLTWLFGPVTAPNDRSNARDGMGGLRVIGRLDLPGGQQINSIFALKYYPPAKGQADDNGRIALLSDVDNFRVEARLFDTGTVRSDYAHQSFRVAAQGRSLKMRPGFYADANKGVLTRAELAFPALGTRCITCHNSGPKITAEQLAQMESLNYRDMKGFSDFLEQMRHWGAGKQTRQKVEAIMETQGPAALLPLNELFEANRDYWLSIYPRYQDRQKFSQQTAGLLTSTSKR